MERTGKIQWVMQTSEEELKREIIRKYFVCNATLQMMDRYRLRTGKYPGATSREFVAHALGLWRAAAPLIGQDQSRWDSIHDKEKLGEKLAEAKRCFYEVSGLLRKSGILQVRKTPRAEAKAYGHIAGAGIAYD